MGLLCLFANSSEASQPLPGGGGTTLPDADKDGTPDEQDACPLDPTRTVPGDCGCQDEILRIMPVGDSLTVGFPISGGWRLTFWQKWTALGLAFDFVGTKANNQNPGLPDPQHEGHIGYNIENLRVEMATFVDQVGGDIDLFLVMAGVNDVTQDKFLSQADDRLLALLQEIALCEPDAQIVGATLTPRVDPNEEIDTIQFNADVFDPVTGAIAQAQALGIDASFVDMYSALDVTTDLFDLVHPNRSGYDKMAEVWEFRLPEVARAYCFGDGGDQMGCTDCPCDNNVPAGWRTGCMNSSGRAGVLTSIGVPSVAADTLRFDLYGGSSDTFAILASGNVTLPNLPTAPCPTGRGVTSPVLDGLRCMGGNNVQRHGTRALDSMGASTNPWGAPGGPPGGLIQAGGFSAGQTRYFQIFYREDVAALCETGQNTSNGLIITMRP